MMADRDLGTLDTTTTPDIRLWRTGPFWRRRYETRCAECGPVNATVTRGIGWIRAQSHAALHMWASR
jgi:hypothetical protein